MQNLKTTIKGTILTIEIDLAQKGELSASRKSFMVSSTHGAVQIPVGATGTKVSLNLNAYIPNGEYVPTPEETALKAAMKAARR
jgi:hypothetical protein